MKVDRVPLLNLGFVVVSFILAAAFYNRLPVAVPTHWNMQGLADGFTPKPWGPFMLPMFNAGVLLLFFLIPKISPRRFRIEHFARVFAIIQTAIIAFFFLVSLLVLVAGMGVPVPLTLAIQVALGVLWIVIGNFMGKLTKNFFVGIRTPWTLASDEVWLRTHRLGGKLFVLAGMATILSGLLSGGWLPLLSAIVVAAGVPVAYSFCLYRRIEGFPDQSDPDDATTNPTRQVPGRR